jgi:GntR family transcriptional repressor for pyruvate dehydrogenase complex
MNSLRSGERLLFGIVVAPRSSSASYSTSSINRTFSSFDMLESKVQGQTMARNFLTPITRTTLTADICRKLVDQLARGDWKEGNRIPSERELGQRLNVGRASLREALKALEIMGMIETRSGEGMFVSAKSEFLARPILWAITEGGHVELSELIEARKLMEVELSALAAARATEDDLEKIREHLDKMEAAIENPDIFFVSDLNFHLAIAEAAHNRILLRAVQLIRNLMRQWMADAARLPGTPRLAFGQHRAVFLAIKEKNQAAARATMAEHLDAMATRLRCLQETSNPSLRESAEVGSD